MYCRVRPLGILVFLIICLGLLSGAASAQGFSADLVWQADRQTMQGKIYVSQEKSRFETGGTISIVRPDKKLVWLLMPDQKMYMEQGYRPQNAIPSSDPLPGEVERIFLGTETVNGITANKYRISVKADNRVQVMFMWLMADKGLPVKMSSEDGKWTMEYRNIQLEDPDPGLFEIPPGYQKFSMSMNFGQ